MIEIPYRQGHLDESADDRLSQEEGCWRELPVLACLGGVSLDQRLRDSVQNLPVLAYDETLAALQNLASQFDVDDETHLVCQYLAANEYGTIDELYRATAHGGPKVR